MTMTRERASNARDCPNCDLPREDWPDDQDGGYAKDGIVYCCRGCVEGTGCSCRARVVDDGTRAPTQDEIRDDPASGDFVQSLQRETKHIDDDDYGTDVTTGRPPGATSSND